ncbi:MAG: DEAD/DEAH box helicase family protein [Bacilli bacterium]|nr:DEAD/DEAH box helicase family protein [Bacilli bacterium]
MKLKFKHQSYQDDAVNSLVNCFVGQKRGSRKDLLARYNHTVDTGLFAHEEEIEVISFGNNSITLTESERKHNIREVQRLNDINYTDGQPLDEFSIEMETGTGKTFTYIKSMYELNKEYGWSKFIVMVPSIAIREGVQKSFDITQDYFQEQYHKKIRYFVYNSSNSSNIANINTFASDDSIQVMIINYQAFNAKGTANRRIYEELDELQSRRPIDVIKSVHPILIIDEPQKFGDKTEELFKEFKPLFKIRYSATHKKGKEYNKIYRLDAIDAYNQKLVKKINVKGIEVLHNKSEDTYMFLDSVNISKKHDPEAIMEIEVKSSNGVSRRLMKIKAGDDLYIKSGELQQYKGYVVSEIDGRYDQYDKVFFTNGEEIQVGQATGDVDESHIVRIQIRETIRSHFEKEKELHKIGIKVLSLFFIDEVAKYKYYEDGSALKGEYAKIFEEEYTKALADYRTLFDEDYTKYLDSFETGKIHAGYFSIDKKGHEVDPSINDKKEYLSFDEDAYDLIMKDKERLLSLEEPVRFIFSHSALREGWDNPNIFQICTLKHSNSEISKRQEIGRGLRICVNNDGERMDYSVLENNFHSINTLTVVASESYDSFAKALQTEISESLSERPKNFIQESFIGKVLTNENGEHYEFTQEHYQDLLIFNVINGYVDQKDNYKITDKFVEDMENGKLEVMPALVGFEEQICTLMKRLYSTNNTKLVSDERRENIKSLVPNANFMKKEFQDLWNKINIKTIYEVDFNTEELVEKAINAINVKLHIAKMQVRITEGEQKDKITSVSINSGNSMTAGSIKTETVEDFTPSQVEYDLIGEITKDTGLTRKTIIEILSKITPEKFSYYQYNPEEFIRKVSNLINQEKATTVIDGITYHKTENKFDNDIFTINNVRGELGENAIDVKKHIYDFLVTDSKNEREFAKKLESGQVTVYAKLPNGFKIPTPVGNYNPDWAIVFDNSQFKYVYFIAETKGSLNSLELRDVEKAKIECAKKHFSCISNDDVKYDVVDSYDSLINILTA